MNCKAMPKSCTSNPVRWIISLTPYNKPDMLGVNIPYVSCVVMETPNRINIMQNKHTFATQLDAQLWRAANIDLCDVLVQWAVEDNDKVAEMCIADGRVK